MQENVLGEVVGYLAEIRRTDGAVHEGDPVEEDRGRERTENEVLERRLSGLLRAGRCRPRERKERST